MTKSDALYNGWLDESINAEELFQMLRNIGTDISVGSIKVNGILEIDTRHKKFVKKDKDLTVSEYTIKLSIPIKNS